VLAELKKQGQMRLYAALMKAKVQSAGGGEVVLAFPEDASFQQELLKGSGDLSRVEEMLVRFMGKPVRLRLKETGEKKAGGGGPGPTGADDSGQEASKPGGDSKKKAGAAEKKAASSDEIVKIVLDKFGGEIIENESKGKE